VGEVGGLVGRTTTTHERLAVGRRRQPGAALIEQDDAVVLQRAAQPSAAVARAGALATRSALQEDEPGQGVVVHLLRLDDLTGVHLDPFAVGRGVVERHVDDVFGADKSALAVAASSHALPFGVEPLVGTRTIAGMKIGSGQPYFAARTRPRAIYRRHRRSGCAR
jgi:hypothetical protein